MKKNKRLDSVDMLVVHCSATQPDADIGVKEIDRWHRDRGWLKVGYHLVIRRDGTVEQGRYLDEQGAHAVEVNDHSLGICLVGGVDDQMEAEDNFSEAQFKALADVLDALLVFYPDAAICGHRDIEGVNKDCPSFNVSQWLESQSGVKL
mgnify:CR=1 FL=1